ncbi:hypothetical protein H2198_007100 [Neophaeococcomyces mojaviensis]|uniref:Uncharacterized protein n=1 Tax=Neophaeococcomyces mojaviensis TaxID=3383035 RepID=A0ACC3A134_9EURO|nr:hypothetical protein H2198_007100 [Knufia sp. JES_112]
MEEHIKAIRSSVIDGIAVTPRYRERQLANLHKALLDSRSQLNKLLVDETLLSEDEATAQFLLTAKAIQTFHISVNPKQCLDEEYRIAQGKDHTTRRVPHGCAYIIPSQHDPLYSTVVPVAAAIAAGNCIVVELQQTVSKLGAFLKKLLLDALSPQTFAVVEQWPFDEEFKGKYCIELNGRETQSAVTTSKQMRTHSNRVAVVVDRSADIKAAARECVKARFGFGGQSAYAPDIVLVNEFSAQSFCTAAAESALQYLSGAANGKLENGKSLASLKRPAGLGAGVQKQLKSSMAETLVSGDRGTVALLKNRDSDLLSGKLGTPLLLIVPISSMDDAINHLGQEAVTLRATYLFCAPPAAKYLSQFISSSVSTINHIPNELLIGPPAPSGHSVSIQPRYTTDMFSIAQPEIIEVSALSHTLSVLVSQDSAVREKRKAEEAVDITLHRVKEAFGPPIGFFEQGLLFGLGCILVGAVTAGVVSVKYGGPAVLAKLRGR